MLLIGKNDAVASAVDLTLARDGMDVRRKAAGHDCDGLDDLGGEVEQFRPDVAIFDVPSPRSRGFGVATFLSHRGLNVICLADTQESRFAALRAGANDCLVKPFSMRQLLSRTHALLSGPVKAPQSAHRVADLVVDETAHAVSRGGNPLDLTRTELELLSVLARHPAQVLSKGQLLAQVWGPGDHDTNLVEVHVCSLRKKLEAHGPQLIHTVRNLGYVLRP